ncbi:transposase [Streptomyces sp. NPDC088748]|uniref:transposase n=1 Tax=Streptomyces sp. NPDC088748 TaxID=3365887 RepID=UPI0037F83F02
MKIRSGSVVSEPVHLAVGVDMDGHKDVPGLWVGAEGEGATTWMAVLSELRNRGIEDLCIVACDGLKGLPCGHRDLSQGHRSNARDPPGPGPAQTVLGAGPPQAGPG